MASKLRTGTENRLQEARLLRYLAMNARSPADFEKLLRQAQSLEVQARTLGPEGVAR